MKQIGYLLIAVLLFSCGNKKKEAVNIIKETPSLTIAVQHHSLKKIKKVFEKEPAIENWKELQAATLFIYKFEKVSPTEALSNALELRDLIEDLKKNEIPEIFDLDAFKARLDILDNEVLRLADLTLIPAITTKEINQQIDKTIDAFSSVNSKINTILLKKQFEEEIDVNLDFIGLDSTKIDSISKKNINLKKDKRIPVDREQEIRERNRQ